MLSEMSVRIVPNPDWLRYHSYINLLDVSSREIICIIAASQSIYQLHGNS